MTEPARYYGDSAEFARAAKAIRHCRETGELPDPSDCGVGTVRELAPGCYELTPNADTRLMGSYWQTDHDAPSGTWRITFNESLDSPDNESRTTRLVLKKP